MCLKHPELEYMRVCITKHISALYIGMAKVLPIIDVLGYNWQNYSFSSPALDLTHNSKRKPYIKPKLWVCRFLQQ